MYYTALQVSWRVLIGAWNLVTRRIWHAHGYPLPAFRNLARGWCRVWGLGFRVQGVGSGVRGTGSGVWLVQDLGSARGWCRVWGLRFRVEGLEIRVSGLGFRV